MASFGNRTDGIAATSLGNFASARRPASAKQSACPAGVRSAAFLRVSPSGPLSSRQLSFDKTRNVQQSFARQSCKSFVHDPRWCLCPLPRLSPACWFCPPSTQCGAKLQPTSRTPHPRRALDDPISVGRPVGVGQGYKECQGAADRHSAEVVPTTTRYLRLRRMDTGGADLAAHHRPAPKRQTGGCRGSLLVERYGQGRVEGAASRHCPGHGATSGREGSPRTESP